MKRLTIKKWFDCYMPDQETTAIRADNYIHIIENGDPRYDRQHHYLVGEAVDKLAHYEDLEEQGLLLKLPCKMGSIVYQVYDDVYQFEVIGFYEHGGRAFISLNCKDDKCHDWGMTSDINDVGKRIFLTREEAEKKLEVLRKKVDEC